MRLCWCSLTVLLSLFGAGAAFEFVSSAQDCKDVNMRCILLSECPAYKTKASILRNRPIVCGFERGGALVCCGLVVVRRRLVAVAPEPDEPMGRHGAAPVRRKSVSNSERYQNRSSPVAAARTSGDLAEVPPKPTAVIITPHVGKVGVNRAPASAASVAPPSPLPKMCGQPRVPASPADGSPNSGNSVAFAKDLFAVRLPRVNKHILGGGDVALVEQTSGGPTGHRWPWIVLFGRWTDAVLGDWFCGGTLITDRHILTAAHCLRSELPTTIGVRIGEHDLGSPDEVDHQERNVSRIVLHPQFRGAQNDLAVVQLSQPVESTFSVEPVCLPSAGAEHVGQDVQAAGWGMLEYGGDLSDILQEVPLRVADPVACEELYRTIQSFGMRFPDGDFQNSQLCAVSRDEEKRDACEGDSGGPLVVQKEDGGFELVGVVSTGVGCGTEFPGLYAKVSSYIDWIVSNLT